MLKVISIVETGKNTNNLSLLEADKFEMCTNENISLGGLIVQELTFVNGKITKVELTNKDLDFNKSNITVVLELKKKQWYPTLIKIPDVSLFTFLSFRSDLQYFLTFLGYEVEDHEFYNHITIDNKVYKLFDTVITDNQPLFKFSIDKGLSLNIDDLVQDRLNVRHKGKENNITTNNEGFTIASKVSETIYGEYNDEEINFSVEYDPQISGDVCYINLPKQEHENLSNEVKDEVNKVIKSYQRRSDFLRRITLRIED